jgi:hypothetical protein
MRRMRWSVVVPGALVPAPLAADVIGAASMPQLARLIARSVCNDARSVHVTCDGAAHLGWLWQRFSGCDTAPITAPYAWRALQTDAPPNDAALWQADPVHFAFARDHMLVTSLTDLAPDEAHALAAEARDSTQQAGGVLHVIDRHWFLAFSPPWSLQTTPLAAALGESVQHLLPVGDDSGRWRKLLTEVQIAWHQHPVNEAREARGAVEVNGLWLHGGGPFTPLPPSGLAQVASDDSAVRGWALASGVAPNRVRTGGMAPVADGDQLTDWPHLFTSFKADAWGAWLPQIARFDAWLGGFSEQAFAAGAEVDLVLCGRRQTRTLRLTAGDRWRPWRRQSLSAAFSEQMNA